MKNQYDTVGHRSSKATMRLKPSRPQIPKGLKPEAKAEWNRVVDCLSEVNAINKVHRSILLLYVEAWARARLAEELIQANGVLVTGDKGCLVKNPAIQIKRDASMECIRYMKELGITPASMNKVPISADEDEVDELLGY